jgi:hypothetical protein
MPPSPALRCSPARDPQVERHKRGRSLEITPQARDRDKDDDLALFQDMQTREKDSFLQHSGDDSDESLCNFSNPCVILPCFSDLHLFSGL